MASNFGEASLRFTGYSDRKRGLRQRLRNKVSQRGQGQGASGGAEDTRIDLSLGTLLQNCNRSWRSVPVVSCVYSEGFDFCDGKSLLYAGIGTEDDKRIL